MKQIYLWLLVLFTTLQVDAQISIIEGFEGTTTPTGWTYTSFARSTTAPCVGVASVRRNFWASGLAGSVTTSNQVAASNGQAITFSFDWKTTEYSAGSGVGVSMDIQYSTDNGTNWTTLGNVTSTTITTCATWTQTIPAGTIPTGSDFKVRFNGTRTAGDCYFYIDNINITQPTTTPPNCTTLTSPANGATGAPITGVLTWTAATGAPSGYKLKVGTTSGGSDVLNNLDVGNVITYDIPGFLNGNTTYYVTVTPYNANGNATGCSETSFTTLNVPVGAGCANPIVVSSLPYTTTDDTTNYLDLIDGTPGATGCGSTNNYLNGNDVFYSYTASITGSIHVKLTPTNTYSGIFVYDNCSNVGTSCIAGMANAGTTIREFDLNVTTGQTYYFVISTWASPQTTPYTFELSINSTNTMDWNNIQWLSDGTNGSNSSLSVPAGTAVTAYAEGWEDGVTNMAGQGTGVQAWIAYSTTDTDPSTWPSTAWVAATYVDDQGNNDNFSAPINISAPGTYYVASRWKIGTGPYSYGGYNGPWSSVWTGAGNKSIQLIIQPVANDNCTGAQALTVGANFASNPVNGTLTGASTTSGLTPSCQTSINSDVWYSVVVPASGNVTIEAQVSATNTITDGVIAVYSGTCGSLTQIACDDDSGPTGANNFMPILTVTGQTPGSTLYVAFWKYGTTLPSTTEKDFIISAYDCPSSVAAPTGATSQSFCSASNPTVANLAATGTAIKWYDAVTGGTELASSTALVNGTTYYASQTTDCESFARLAVTVTINTTPAAPTGSATQLFCSASNPTVASLVATGTAIKWYDAATAGTELVSTTALISGNTYYASQTVNGCESINRLAVTVTVNTTPSAPTGNATQTFCATTVGNTLAVFSVTGSGIVWYDTATGGNILPSSTVLTDGTTYYASQTVNGCESTARLAVTADENCPCLNSPNGQWPSATYTPSVCDGVTVGNITTAGYAGEYSKVNVVAGQTYTFQSSIATDYITISDEAGTTAYAAGTTPLVWVSTVTGVIRFYTHISSNCDDDTNNRTRSVICGTPPTQAPDCPTLVTPANGATGVNYPTASFSWTPATTGGAVSSYDVYLDTVDGSTLLGNTTLTTVNINGLLASTTYYWKVVAKNSVGASVGCTVFSFTTMANPFAPYCGPLDFTTNVEPITLVNFAGINNVTSEVLNGTPDHENFISISGNVEQGMTYPITLKGNTDGNYTNRFVVFIDWNQNGVLNDAGEVNYGDGTLTIINSTGVDAVQAVGSIAVPANAVIGTTRMRVKKLFGTTNTADPCLATSYGQAEDYTINVAAAGVDDINSSIANLTLYPNPTKGLLYVKSDKQIVSSQVFDLNGALIMDAKVTNNSVDVTELQNGSYVLKAILEDGTSVVEKFIKN